MTVRRVIRQVALVVTSMAVVVASSGCVPLSEKYAQQDADDDRLATASADASIPEGLEDFYTQEVTWTSCADAADFECTRVTVPLDYENPDGDTLEIAVTVHAASGTSQGYLLMNPGGPGGSGYTYVQDYLDYLFSSDLIDNYDIVGFDPRGVGESSAVQCFDTDAEKDEFMYGEISAPLGSDEYQAEVETALDDFASGCEQLSGDLLEYVDTTSAAQDMDIIRAVLGTSTLNYLGFSYGTFLGAIYADLFPERVGRFVLDGAEDPSLDITELTVGQLEGFDQATRAYLASCLSGSDCPFTGTVEDAVEQVDTLLTDLADTPLVNSDGRELGMTNMLQVIFDCMYDSSYWSVLSMVVAAVISGDPSSAFSLLDQFNERSSDGSYGDNSTEAFYAIMCADYVPRDSEEEIAQDAELYRETSDLFGQFYATDAAMCADWPVTATRVPAEVHASGSGPILVVGTTGDPATPYAWAESLDEQLDNSMLLAVEGYQHTAYSSSASSCVITAVDTFLLEGEYPAEGTVCDAA
ncbi:MAG TPA: alpha/beta hydrolase [Pseudoclavibacter sp.]|nr:alpha/beta hydrolase [Pseudoclavibacter sp.]